MTWPSSDVPTTGLDAGTDVPPRSVFMAWAAAFNQLRNHVTGYMQGLLASADAAAARASLDVPSRAGGNASGTWGISITGNAATATTASNCSRSVSGGGLATGGGALTGNRTINVAEATQPEADSGTGTGVITARRLPGAISALANPLPAIAASSVGAVGTEAMLQEMVNAGVDRMPGDLLPGDQLTYSNTNGNSSGTSPSGIWQLRGYSAGSPSNIARTSIWLRVY